MQEKGKKANTKQARFKNKWRVCNWHGAFVDFYFVLFCLFPLAIRQIKHKTEKEIIFLIKIINYDVEKLVISAVLFIR